MSNYSQGVQANFVINEQRSEESDDEIIETFATKQLNMRDVGLQTSEMHFVRLTKTKEFQLKREERDYSSDWAYSSIMADLAFVKH